MIKKLTQKKLWVVCFHNDEILFHTLVHDSFCLLVPSAVCHSYDLKWFKHEKCILSKCKISKCCLSCDSILYHSLSFSGPCFSLKSTPKLCQYPVFHIPTWYTVFGSVVFLVCMPSIHLSLHMIDFELV